MMLRPLVTLLTLAVVTAGCGGGDSEDARVPPPTPDPTPSAGAAVDVSAPAAGWTQVDLERLERERFDASWREAADRERGERAGRPAEAAGAGAESGAPVERLRRAATSPTAAGPTPAATPTGATAAQTWADIAPGAFEGEPALPIGTDAAGPTVFRLQWMLDRARYSPGVIDGRWGKNTEKAIYWLQDSLGAETTGTPDRALFDRLASLVERQRPVRKYTVTAGDLEGPFTEIPEEPAEQAELECLCYSSVKEALADRFHTTIEMLEQLNSGTDLDGLTAGTAVWVPNVEEYRPQPDLPDRVARIVVSKGGFYLHALGSDGTVLYHFPTTVGAGYDPSPSGQFSVRTHAYRPDFHYQPELFSDVPDERAEQMLPPGPNSPVGLVWLDLSKPHYGIHGTSAPETIGYATSHGCVRLTNWDALFLANHTADGTPVEFRE